MAGKIVGALLLFTVGLTVVTDVHNALEVQIAQVSTCIDRLGPTTVGPCT